MRFAVLHLVIPVAVGRLLLILLRIAALVLMVGFLLSIVQFLIILERYLICGLPWVLVNQSV